MKGKKQLGTTLLELGRLQVRHWARSVAQCSRQTHSQLQVTVHQIFWEIEKALAETNHYGDDKGQGKTNDDGS